MAIKRGPDGVPIDMPSVKNTDEPSTETTPPKQEQNFIVDDEPTLKTSGSPASPAAEGLLFDEPPTTPARSTSDTGVEPEALSTMPSLDEPPTVVGRSGATAAPAEGATSPSQQSDPMADPVSGWLVVVEGPGKGNYLKLGYGQNSIGRNPTERVSVNFGDSQISRQNHATISYDPRGNQFYIQPGSGTNMTYLDGQPAPVLQPMVLPPLSTIVIGDSKLRFVPLCGEDFSWDQLD